MYTDIICRRNLSYLSDNLTFQYPICPMFKCLRLVKKWNLREDFCFLALALSETQFFQNLLERSEKF